MIKNDILKMKNGEAIMLGYPIGSYVESKKDKYGFFTPKGLVVMFLTNHKIVRYRVPKNEALYVFKEINNKRSEFKPNLKSILWDTLRWNQFYWGQEMECLDCKVFVEKNNDKYTFDYV